MDNKYLHCERRDVYALLMFSAGIVGAYTFMLRGGVFCNAQTANVVLMAIALGEGDVNKALYYIIPIGAYCAGAIISEALPKTVNKLRFLRWDTYLIAVEMAVLFAAGLIPLSYPNQTVQIMINFIASMQYNTFRRMEGIPMATTFCTNHIRQVGIAAVKYVKKKDRTAMNRGLAHLFMIGCFFAGGVLLSLIQAIFGAKSIWIALIPTGVVFVQLSHADLTTEHDKLNQKPWGH